MKQQVKSTKATKRVAIVTYNRIGEGQYDNGLVEGKKVKLFVAQNGHKSKWVAHPDNDSDTNERTRAYAAKHVAGQLELTDMDHVYLYVGSDGGEEAIRATRDLPAANITYVMCYCNSGWKREMVKDFGHGESKIVYCECGGRETLARIAADLLS